jgi:integrase
MEQGTLVPDTAVLPHMRVPPGWLALPAPARERLRAYAGHTRRALAADWGVWWAWCTDPTRHADGRPRTALPVTAPVLLEFLRAHSPPIVAAKDGTLHCDRRARGEHIRAASTLARYLSSLRTLHRHAGHPDDPTRHGDVEALRRVVMRGRRDSTPKRALTLREVRKILRRKWQGRWDVRDRAVVAVAYCAMTRRSELVALTVEDVTWHADGAASVRIRRTKTDDSGRGRVGYLAPFAADALKKWLELAGIEAGPLFRRILPNEALGTEALEPKEVARIFKRMLEKIGASAKEVAATAGHSARIGAAHDLVSRGYDLPGIMQAGGWASPAMPAHYARELLAARNAMAQMLGRRRDRR